MRPPILDEKIVLETPYFQLRKIRFKIGYRKSNYDVIRSPIVVVFPITDKNEVYLIRQYRYLYNSIITEPIAGHVEKGESSTKAAARELKEEAGIEALQLEEFARLESSGSVVKSTVHYFLAKGLEFTSPTPEDDEEIELFKISLSEAKSEVMTGTIRNSSAVVGILMLQTMVKEKKI